MYDTGPGDVRDVRRIGAVETTDPATMGRLSVFGSKISWGAVVSGVIVGVAVSVGLSLLAAWAGFGLHDISSLTNLSSRATAAGIWITVSSLIAVFIGGWIASRMAGSFTVANGLYHGLVTWGLYVVSSVVLSLFGVVGILGFGITSNGVLKAIPGTTTSSFGQASSISSTYAGWFLLAFVVSFAAGLLGGWVGAMGASQRAATSGRTYESVEERRAA